MSTYTKKSMLKSIEDYVAFLEKKTKENTSQGYARARSYDQMRLISLKWIMYEYARLTALLEGAEEEESEIDRGEQE
jgi:hypothetical protein